MTYVYPMSPQQFELIETLRKQQNISADVLNRLVRKHWECEVSDLSVRQASALIDSLKMKTEIQREIQLLAGQQSLFGEVLA